MQDDYSQFEQRKKDHIQLALMQINQAEEQNILDSITLQHDALPDLNFNEIEITGSLLNTPAPKPFVVGSMTAGHSEAGSINYNLISACAQQGWAMGVGSQRRELTDKNAKTEWSDLRKNFPKVTLFSNLGIAQLISTPINKVLNLAEGLNAQAIIIHCNPLQECIQPEGTPDFKGCWDALEGLVKNSPLPIVVKETGCGFSQTTLIRLNNMGVAAVDVSGLGGTHWGRIEGQRANIGSIQQKASVTFRNWGVDTVNSVINAVSFNPSFEIWGSGGVRHGLDAAKLFALGASSISFAKPMLEAALISSDQVVKAMELIEYELKVAMFCTGSRYLTDLKEKACC
jgi:isopentenyl-diphosphate delta-isomerase